jgi:hypothetical protein
MLNTSYDHGCHLANRLDPEDYEALLIVAGLVLYMQFDITIKVNATAWREFLGGRGAGRCKELS